MAMHSKKITLTTDGKVINTMPGTKLKTGMTKKNDVVTDQGPVGYDVEYVAPSIEAIIPHNASTSFRYFESMQNSTVYADVDTGKSFIFTGVYCKSQTELDDGKLKVELGAISCKEV